MQPNTLTAIEKACQAVLDGKYHDQFGVANAISRYGTVGGSCVRQTQGIGNTIESEEKVAMLWRRDGSTL